MWGLKDNLRAIRRMMREHMLTERMRDATKREKRNDGKGEINQRRISLCLQVHRKRARAEYTHRPTVAGVYVLYVRFSVCVMQLWARGKQGPAMQQVLAISRLSAPLSPVCLHAFTLASAGLHHSPIWSHFTS